TVGTAAESSSPHTAGVARMYAQASARSAIALVWRAPASRPGSRIETDVQNDSSSPIDWRKKQIGTPTAAISAPATAGPAVRVTLFPAEFSATAFARSSRGTALGTSVWRTGNTIAIAQ